MKIKGTVLNVSTSNKGILLDVNNKEAWFNTKEDVVNRELIGNEVELTLINPEKRIFSDVAIVKANVQKKEELGTRRENSIVVMWAHNVAAELSKTTNLHTPNDCVTVIRNLVPILINSYLEHLEKLESGQYPIKKNNKG